MLEKEDSNRLKCLFMRRLTKFITKNASEEAIVNSVRLSEDGKIKKK